MPDGTVVQGVPDGITQSKLAARYSKYQGAAFPDKSEAQQPQNMWQDFSSGAARGAANAAFGISQLIPGGSHMMFGASPDEVSNAAQGLKDESQNRGWSGLAGEMVGDPRNLALSLLPGGLAARTLEGAAYGATDPSTKKTFEGQLQDKGINAAENAALFAAVPAVVDNTIKGAQTFAKGIGARSGGALDDALQEMKDTASASYKRSEDAGAVFTPQAANNIATKLDNIVPEPSTKASQNLYSDTLKAINGFQDDVTAPGQELSLQTLDRHRQVLANIANNFQNPNRAQEAQMASKAVSALDDAVEKIDPSKDIVNGNPDAIDALNQARAQWAKSKKFETVSNIVKKATIDGKIDPQKIQRGFQSFIQKRGNLRGFSDSEIDTFKAAANNGLNEKILKGLQAFGLRPEHLFSSVMAPGVVAKYVSEPLGLALGAAGTIARPIARNLAKGRAERVLQEIEK